MGLRPINGGLELYCNNFGDWGANVVAELLKSNTSVTHLTLSENSIGEEGGKAIGKALTSNTCVTHLDLRHNSIGAEGGKALLSSLNATLEHLWCFSPHLSNSTAFARLLATTHHKRPDINVSFSR